MSRNKNLIPSSERSRFIYLRERKTPRPVKVVNGIGRTTMPVIVTYSGVTSYRVVETVDGLYGIQVLYPDSDWTNLVLNGNHTFKKNLQEVRTLARNLSDRQGTIA